MKKRLFTCVLIIITLFILKRPKAGILNKNISEMNQSIDSLPGDSSSLNFWKGIWNATWEEEGKKITGKNVITEEMKGKVIQEEFSILDGANKGYRGHSVSVFDKTCDRWRQTWVDSDGSYLDFTGYKKGSDFYFERSFTGKKGKLVRQRMHFYDIKLNSYSWDWENAIGEGPWQLLWRIQYTKAK